MKETHTKHRPIRVEDGLWETFGQLVGTRNRSAVIREFLRWYVREHGARLPARPGAGKFGYPGDDPELLEGLKRARNSLVHGMRGSERDALLSFDEADSLTPPELQLLFLVADDLPYVEIAEMLNIAPGEAKARLEGIAEKIRASDRVKLYMPRAKRTPQPLADASGESSS